MVLVMFFLLCICDFVVLLREATMANVWVPSSSAWELQLRHNLNELEIF